MKKTNLKKKVAVCVLAVSLIGTSSLAFANTDIGTQFGLWADTQIQNAKNAISTSLGLSTATAQANINGQTNTAKSNAVTDINNAKTAEISDTTANINTKLQEHFTALQNALTTYNSTIGANLDAFANAKNTETTGTLNNQLDLLTNQVTSTINNAKNVAVEDVNEGSLLAKSQATSDLIKEINSTKDALTAELNAQKGLAQEKVDTHLTAEVARLNSALTTLITNLVNDAKVAINTAGKHVEDSTIANFDKVISRLALETPIVVDNQTLTFAEDGVKDGMYRWRVKNTNEFDVVFKWEATNSNANGVSETISKPLNANYGESYFYTPISYGKNSVKIRWQNSNGTWISAFATANPWW